MQWYAPRGCTITLAKLDARPAVDFIGASTIRRSAIAGASVSYKEVVRPERIVYTLATADSAGNQIDPVQAGARSALAARNARDGYAHRCSRFDAADARAERSGVARQAYRRASELAADARSPRRDVWRRKAVNA
jgi:uncharacterized protein YndB with AHSA1/START domain